MKYYWIRYTIKDRFDNIRDYERAISEHPFVFKKSQTKGMENHWKHGESIIINNWKEINKVDHDLYNDWFGG